MLYTRVVTLFIFNYKNRNELSTYNLCSFNSNRYIPLQIHYHSSQKDAVYIYGQYGSI